MPLYVYLRQALIVCLLLEFSSKAIAAPLNVSSETIVYAPAASELQANPPFIETIFFNPAPSAGTEVEKLISATRPATATPAPQQAKVYRIMPLGDSNTEGGSSAIAVQNRAGYRDRLEELLNGSDLKGRYDFVGSENTGGNLVEDTNHAGFGGARDEDIAALLKDGRFEFYNTGEYRGPGGGSYLDQYNPDIILLHIGTNSVWDNPSDVSDVVDILDQVKAYEVRAKKEVTVILAKIILTAGADATLNPATVTYNNNVRAMAEKRVQDGDNIVFVDMQAGAGIIYKVAAENSGPTEGDMMDNLHPNMKGYDKMAQVWFDALQDVITTDTQAPETTINDNPAAVSNKNSATFTFSSNEDDVIYQVSFDGAAFAQATSPYIINGLADGQHTFKVRAVDAAGNMDQTPATYTWLVDTKAPAAPVVTSPANGAILRTNKPTIGGTAEAGSTVAVTVDATVIGSVQAANGNWTITPATALAEGTHTVSAKASDAAGNVSAASVARNFTIDSKAPETSIAPGLPDVSNKSELTFSFGSNEAGVTYWVKLDNAAFVAVASPYTASNLQDGSHTLAVRAVDAAGNTDATPDIHNWMIDTKAPGAPSFTGISEDRGPQGNDQVTADNTIQIAGKAEANAVVRISEKGEEIGSATANSAGNWEFNYEDTSLAQGIYNFTATATDAAGNASAASGTFAVTIELTAPEVSITKAADAPLNAAFDIEIKFTEVIYNLTVADFGVTNGTVSSLTDAGNGIYTAKVTPAADGKVQVNLPAGKTTDLAGNPNKASNLLETTYDATRPQLSLTSDAPAAVNAPFTVTFTFSEAVTGFDAADIAVTNGSAGNISTVNATTYTAQITPGADGEVSIKVAADKTLDAAKNGNEASSTLKRIYDVQRPMVVLSTTAPNPTKAPFTVMASFSEPVKEFVAADLSLTNANASQFSKVDAKTYTVLVTPVASGEVAVSMAANVAQDMATNGNEASNGLQLRYDADRPAVTASTSAAALINEPFRVTFRISEAVTGFDLADISSSNASAANLKKVSEQEYSVLITPASDGKVTVSVPANKMQDEATNGNTASNVLELTYDATAPAGYTVRFGVEKVDVTNQNNVSLQIEGAEKGATYTYTISSSNGGEALTGTAQVSAASFSVPELDLTGLRDGQLTVSLYLTDVVGNKGPEATAQVEKLTKNIELVQALAPIRVPFKTAFKDIPLPEEVEVTYTNGEKEAVNVSWEEGIYNGSVPAQYTLVGVLELKENTSNLSNKTAGITVEVAPNQPPTALSLSQETFEPNIAPHQMIGAFSTTDPDDTNFIYSLVAGEGDVNNQLFEISNGNELTLRSNKGLSGVAKFNIRVRSTDPYANYIEKTFTLTKSLYQPQSKIKLVNAFSPDGDGTNDTWTVPELRYYNSIEVEVFDRAGVRLFHTTNPEEGWDGRGADGRILQGAYFYIIQIKEINLVQKGVLTVLK